jgi:hypothetical protein
MTLHLHLQTHWYFLLSHLTWLRSRTLIQKRVESRQFSIVFWSLLLVFNKWVLRVVFLIENILSFLLCLLLSRVHLLHLPVVILWLRHIRDVLLIIAVCTLLVIETVAHPLRPNRMLHGYWNIAGSVSLGHEARELPTSCLLWSLVDEWLLRIYHTLMGHLTRLDRIRHLTLSHVRGHCWGRLPLVDVGPGEVRLPPSEIEDTTLVHLDHASGFLELPLLTLRRGGRCNVATAKRVKNIVFLNS